MNTKYFWICGKHCVKSAILNKKRKVVKIVTTRKNRFLDENKFNYEVVNKFFFEKTFKNISHQNIAAQVGYLQITEFKNKLDKINNFKNIVILDKITDTGNIGNILRSCVMFNIDAVIFEKRIFKQDSLNMIKNASGAIDVIDIITTSNILNTIKILKNKNFWVTSIDVNGQQALNEYKWSDKNVIIFGSEQKGIGNLLLKNSDYKVSINTKKNNHIDSLNVSNVASITLSHLFNFS